MWPPRMVVAVQRRGTGSAARHFPGNKSDSHSLNSHPEGRGQPSPHSISRRACRCGHCTCKPFDPNLCPHLQALYLCAHPASSDEKVFLAPQSLVAPMAVPCLLSQLPAWSPAARVSTALTNIENIPLLRSQPFSRVPGRGMEGCGNNRQGLVPQEDPFSKHPGHTSDPQGSPTGPHLGPAHLCRCEAETGRRAPSLGELGACGE